MLSDFTKHHSSNCDFLEFNIEKKHRTEGEVRIRSNICNNSNAWYLVPGDMLERYGLSLQDMTQRQRDERMYYEPCCICKRTIFDIIKDGCDHPVCRKQGIPSSAEADLRKQSGYENPESL